MGENVSDIYFRSNFIFIQENDRDQQKIIEKAPGASGLTTETGMGERASLRYKKLEDQKMIRTLLQDQIEKKQKC